MPALFTVTTTLDEVTLGDGKLSLREAITKADLQGGADTIVLPAGVFQSAISGASDNLNFSGDFDITDSLAILGAGAGLTVIDGHQFDRVFDVRGTDAQPIKVILQGLTIRNGTAAGATAGGGIQILDANLVVRDSTIVGNHATAFGGGIYATNAVAGTGNVTVVRSTVARNVAGTSGGGISIDAQNGLLKVTNSTVRRNLAGLNGGGLAASTITLTNSTVSGNFAEIGGGIDAISATLTNSTISDNVAASSSGGMDTVSATLTNCTIAGNFSGGEGGGVRVSAEATVTNSTISGNVAMTAGGGLDAGTANLTNCTICGNSAGTTGGGLFATRAAVLNCTIAENSAHTGGGLYHKSGSSFSVKNTIVAMNLVDDGGSGPDVGGAVFVSAGHNLIGQTGASGFTNGTKGDMVGTTSSPLDPKLGPLQNNGGPTKTMSPKAGSPAIDRGDNSGLPPTDQRGTGFPRKKDGNGDGVAVADIGAFER